MSENACFIFMEFTPAFERSMSAGPRHHGPKMWARDRGDAVRWALRTLAKASGDEGSRREWRDASRQHPPRWRPFRRSEPIWFAGPPPPPRRPFQGSRDPSYWRPRFFGDERRSSWMSPPEQRPGEWRSFPMPRRGPPVAAVKVPRWHRPVVWEERRPRGPEPRGPLRGGPERSAGDPQSAPHGSSCGGPGRSSDDPRLSKTTQAKAKRESKGKKGAKWPTVVTVDKGGQERTWGPLSRTAAWKAGCF